MKTTSRPTVIDVGLRPVNLGLDLTLTGIPYWKAEPIHIDRKKVLRLKLCETFFTRHCIMGFQELHLSLDSSQNKGIW